MAKKRKQRSPEFTLFTAGIVLFVLTLITTGVAIGLWLKDFILDGFIKYTHVFRTDLVNGQNTNSANQGPFSMIVLAVSFVTLALVVFFAFLFIIKRKKKLVIATFLLLVLGVLLCTLAETYAVAQGAGKLTRHGYFGVMISVIPAILAYFSLVGALLIGTIGTNFEQQIAQAVEQKVEEEKKEEKPAEKAEEEKGLTEEDVRRIVREELGKGQQTVVVKVENAPAKEEPVKEEKKEEPVVVAEPEEEEDDSKFPKGSRRRKASFETKLRKSEEDLRHKYYDLRDYIKSYGVKNRISIPGDTFSAHRERYVFVTISGKHIKAYFALDPKAYEGSTIPVKVNDAKKFEDIPVVLKVQSDLSFRRAKQLVDDVMARKGVAKPEEK